MIIDITKVRKIAGEAFPFKVQELWDDLDYQGETISFLSPVSLEGTATNTGTAILVEGKLAVTIQRVCCRCLDVVTQSIQLDFSEEYTPGAEKASLDLSNEVRDQLLLELPIRAVCREDCLGLCPVCGLNLNTGNCSCQQKQIDPRLQALEKFLKP